MREEEVRIMALVRQVLLRVEMDNVLDIFLGATWLVLVLLALVNFVIQVQGAVNSVGLGTSGLGGSGFIALFLL